MNRIFRGLGVLFCTCCFFYSDAFCSSSILFPEDRYVSEISLDVRQMIGYIGAVADLGPDNWPDYVNLSMEEAQKMAIKAYVRLKNHIAELPSELHYGDRHTLGIMHRTAHRALIKLYDLKEEFWDEFLAQMEGIAKLQYDKIPAEVYDDILKWVETQRSIYLESDTPAN